MAEVYLTKEGFEKAREELARLRKQKDELTVEIQDAKAQGDLKENAGYHYAREKQGMVMQRINELELKLREAKLVDSSAAPSDDVRLGATVHLHDEKNGNDLFYTLVSTDEADPAERKISVSSPLAQGLLGAKAGKVVTVRLPAGEKVFKVTKIEYR